MRILRYIMAGMMVLASLGISVHGEETYDEEAFDEATDLTAEGQLAMLREDVNTPAVPNKQKVAIREYMLNQARHLKRDGFKVETTRKGEVLIVTLPTDKMFAPNDSVLYRPAEKLLARFVPYLKNPGLYKLVVTAHSDDTGSEVYQMRLTDARISAVYDYFDRLGVDTSGLFGRPLGGTKPLGPNDSRGNRSLNRRIEIYIVPDAGLISLAKSKKL